MRNFYTIFTVGAVLWIMPLITQAFLADTELLHVAGHAVAATVDVSLLQTEPFPNDAIAPGEERGTRLVVTNDSTLTVQYQVDIILKDNVCDVLDVEIQNGTTVIYSGTLVDFDIVTDTLGVGSDDVWNIIVSTPTDMVSEGGTCIFDIEVYAAPAGGGLRESFFDTEVLADNMITFADTTPPQTPTIIGWNQPTHTIAPETVPVALSCTANGTWTNESLTATLWTDESDSGATIYEYEITQPSGLVINDTVSETFVPFMPLTQEGAWSYRVRGIDAANNKSPWSDVCVLSYDTVAPIIDPASYILDLETPPGTPNAQNGITFSWNTNELSTANIYFDLSPGDPDDIATYVYSAPSPINTTEFSLAHEVLFALPSTGGSFLIKVIAQDRAGNVFETPPLVFNLPSLPSIDVIVLNEIMPNPVGSDSALMPEGEWVELYNRGTLPVDVAGWYVQDANGFSATSPGARHASDWIIAPWRADNNGNTSDSGETIVPAGGFLVVYRNGIGMRLNNSAASGATFSDEVFLWDALGVNMDSHLFNVEGFDEGKSIARFPNGVGIWIDPEGTPGDENELSNSEKDVLRKQTLDECFKNTMRLVKRDIGTICDPIFLVYIDMIADQDSKTLIRPGLIDAVVPQGKSTPQEEEIKDVVLVEARQEDTQDDVDIEEKIDEVSDDAGETEDAIDIHKEDELIVEDDDLTAKEEEIERLATDSDGTEADSIANDTDDEVTEKILNIETLEKEDIVSESDEVPTENFSDNIVAEINNSMGDSVDIVDVDDTEQEEDEGIVTITEDADSEDVGADEEDTMPDLEQEGDVAAADDEDISESVKEKEEIADKEDDIVIKDEDIKENEDVSAVEEDTAKEDSEEKQSAPEEEQGSTKEVEVEVENPKKVSDA